MLSWIAGDESRLGFLFLASVRSHLMRQPLLTCLTTLVVALAVALVVALTMSSSSVDQALSRSAEALKGKVDLEVTAGGVGVPERLLDEVAAVPGVASAAPVIETIVRILGGPRDGQPLRLLGVDLLADQSARTYSIVHRDLRVLDPVALIAGSDSVIISKLLADQLGVSDGNTLRVRSSKGEHALVVRGLLAPGGMGDAYAGQVAVMDVYALQTVLGQQSQFDRIDVVLEPGASLDLVTSDLTGRVAGVATVIRPNDDDSFLGAAISTMQLMGATIGIAGVLVAGILCYASSAAAVDRRVRLFGLLRAAGLEARRIHRLVYADSLVVAVVGTGLGVLLGWSISGVFQAVFSEALSSISGGEIAPARMSFPVLALAACLGIGVSFFSAVLAARRSTRLPAHEAIAGGRGLSEESVERAPSWSLVAAAALLLACFGASRLQLPLPAGYRVAIVFALGIALVWVAIVPLLGVLLSSVRIGFERWAPGVGRIAAGSLRVRLYRTQIAAVSVAVLVATAASLWMVTTSVFDSVDRFNSVNGGSFIATMASFDARFKNLLDDESVREISETPGVEAVFQHFVSSTIFRGKVVRLSAITPEVWAERVGFDIPERAGKSDADFAHLLQSGGVFVYDSFERAFGLGAGDTIQLDTPQGPREFPIIGVRRVYTMSPVGGVQMALSTFDQHWPRAGVSNLLVWTSGNEQSVLDSIQKRIARPLVVMASAVVDRSWRTTLEQNRVLIFGLLSLIVTLAGSAVASLMLTSAFERRGDLALLHCIGASRRQLLVLLLLQSTTLAAVGASAGIGLGIGLVRPLSGIVTESMGWVISWSVDFELLAGLVAGILCLSVAIGALSAIRARSGASWNNLAPE